MDIPLPTPEQVAANPEILEKLRQDFLFLASILKIFHYHTTSNEQGTIGLERLVGQKKDNQIVGKLEVVHDGFMDFKALKKLLVAKGWGHINWQEVTKELIEPVKAMIEPVGDSESILGDLSADDIELEPDEEEP